MTILESFFRNAAAVTMRHSRLTLILVVPFAALCVLGAMRIHPTGSIEAMLPADDPATAVLTRITREFGVLDDLIVLATVTDTNLVAARRIEHLRSFADRLQTFVLNSSESRELCSAVNYRDFAAVRDFIEREMVPAGLFYLDPKGFARIRKRLSKEGIQEQIRRNEDLISAPGAAGHALSKLILRDPLRLHEVLAEVAIGRFNRPVSSEAGDLTLSLDGSTLMIRLTGTRRASDLDFAKRFVGHIIGACGHLNIDGLKLEYTGAYAIAVEAERSIRRDMIQSITMSSVMLGLLFLMAYRGLLTFPMAVVPVALGILCAFGLDSLYTTELTPVVAVMGAVLAGLAIDYPIHLLSHYGYCKASGLSTSDAIAATLATVGPPMAAACATSMVGFLAIAVSSVPALRQLAVLGMIGLAASFLAAVLVLPPLLKELSVISTRLAHPRRLGEMSLISILRSRSFLFIGATCAVLVGLTMAIILSPRYGFELDEDLTVMHPRPNPPMDSQRTIAKLFGHDADPLIVFLQSDSPLDLVRLAHQVDRRLRNTYAKSVGRFASFGPAALLPDPDQVIGRRQSVRELDAAQIVSDFEAAIDHSLFDASSYRDYMTFLREFCERIDAPNLTTLLRYPSVARMMLPLSAIGSGSQPSTALAYLFIDQPLDARAKRDAAIHAVRNALEGLPGATLTGVAVVSSDTETIVWRELRRMVLIAAGIIAFFLLVYFRRLGDTMLALLPVLFAIVCLLGMMQLLNLRPNLINLIAIPLLLGAGIDHGVFLVSLVAADRRRRRKSQGLAREIGLATHPLMMTTLTTLLGFGSLAFTSTPAIRSLGQMVAIGMTACLAGTFLLLVPILLRRAGNRPSSRAGVAS